MGISKNGSGKKVGEIFIHAGNVAPPGAIALPLAATTVSRSAYKKLFDTVGTIWGAGDGVTTFGLPWCKENETVIQSNGNVGSRTVGEVIAHSHAGGFQVTVWFGPGGGGAYGAGNSPATGSTGGTANLPAGSRFLLCIQYK